MTNDKVCLIRQGRRGVSPCAYAAPDGLRTRWTTHKISWSHRLLPSPLTNLAWSHRISYTQPKQYGVILKAASPQFARVGQETGLTPE
jgi:hypothetical protein